MKLLLLGLILGLFLIPGAMADSTQQYNKVLLTPFYRASMVSGTNYTYTISVNPPDSISSVASALIGMDVYLTPTVTYNAFVDGKSCATPSFTISTTYSGASQGRLVFDCSNVITKAGTYAFTINANKNSGASTAWLDITYSNRPKATMDVFGTEYNIGQDGKLWVQLINSTGQSVENAVCLIHIYTPQNTQFVERGSMSSLGEEGIYYYDFAVPDAVGVYPTVVECFYSVTQTSYTAVAVNITVGTLNSPAGTQLSIVQTKNNAYWRIQEAVNPTNYNLNVGLNFTVPPAFLLTDVVFDYWGKWNGGSESLTIQFWNFTNNTWQSLPNLITDTGGANLEVTNTISTTDATASGIRQAVTNQTRIRIIDQNISDLVRDELQVDYFAITTVSKSGQIWEDVKGSSEIHVSSIEDLPYRIETLCADTSAGSSACAVFDNDTLFNLPEGVLKDNITILAYETEDSYWKYESPQGISCNSIYTLEKYNTTSLGWDMINLSSVAFSSADSNCLLQVPIELVSGESYEYRIVMDNYMKYKVIQNDQITKTVEATTSPFCYGYGASQNYTYQIPIEVNTSVSSDPILRACHYGLDLFFWNSLFYNQSTTVKVAGPYITFYQELEWTKIHVIDWFGQFAYYSSNATGYERFQTQNATYYAVLANQAQIASVNQTVLDTNSSIASQLSDITALINQIPSMIWNYTSRTLTSFSFAVNVTQEVLDNIWNYPSRVLTTYSVQNFSYNYTYPVTVEVVNQTVNVTNAIVYNTTVNVTTQIVNVTTGGNGTMDCDEIGFCTLQYWYATRLNPYGYT